MEWIWNHKHFS